MFLLKSSTLYLETHHARFYDFERTNYQCRVLFLSLYQGLNKLDVLHWLQENYYVPCAALQGLQYPSRLLLCWIELTEKIIEEKGLWINI